jgi:hypothetical protein
MSKFYDEDGIDGPWEKAMNLNDDLPMYPPPPPMVVCPVCDRTVTRSVLADAPVHRSCGRELESVWTWCVRCASYRHHGQFATKLGDMSVCHECGKTRRFREGR